MSITIRMVVSMVMGLAALLILAFLVQTQTGGLETFLGGTLP